MSRRTMKIDDVKVLLAEILSADDAEHEINIEDINERIALSYISKANDMIHDFDLEIKIMLDQRDRSKTFALINTTSDELAQLATTHNADEIAFFKRVLDAIFETNNTRDAEVLAVHDFAAVRLHKNPQQGGASQPTQGSASQSASGLTMVGAEAALGSFVDEGWLECSKAGFYSLTSRALLELGPYLFQAYNTPADEYDEHEDDGSSTNGIIERIKTCHACREIVTIGLRCTDKHCKLRLHTPCAEGTFRPNRAHECPHCKKEWNGGLPVGEEADRGQRRPRGNRQSNVGTTPRARVNSIPQPASTRRATRGMRDTPIDEDSQGDEDEEDAPGEGNGDDVEMAG
ncbi:Nse1 non-SMC component of SMC5-6 complex-domain-containing protein [Tuber borchii]|uniref:Non-structural maintenance of chromosomes element 1 homolog n=1 Tax=Tuber borchii TaxID=42251 RepID=A0A2T7A0H6_TUBBO|nr:Nse1 non-SMC component of SMC5-6 complex-domain-containing protein [Tuber borchii]